MWGQQQMVKVSKQMRNEQRNAKTKKCANKRKKHSREYTWVKNRVTLEKKLSNPDVWLKNLRFAKASNVVHAERYRRSEQGKDIGTQNSPIREDVRNCIIAEFLILEKRERKCENWEYEKEMLKENKGAPGWPSGLIPLHLIFKMVRSRFESHRKEKKEKKLSML